MSLSSLARSEELVVNRPTNIPQKKVLILLDFDGFLIDSYTILKLTFEHFGLNVGDETRFKHRRKFLKYLGGGKELVGNFLHMSLPPKKEIRAYLTDAYASSGQIYPAFVNFLNDLIADPRYHVGIVSRNFTYTPGLTIRRVLNNSQVNEEELDFVIPIPVGAKKKDILEAMQSARYRRSFFGADEVGDYKAASETGYESIMAAYGFDSEKRLMEKGGVDRKNIFRTPRSVVSRFEQLLL